MRQTRLLVLSLSILAAPAAAQQVASVQLSHSSLSLPVGGRQTVFATAYTSSGAPVGAQFRWVSSDPAVATVEVSESESDFAEIVAVGPGSARVTVQAGSRSASVTLTVIPAGAGPAVVGTGPAAVLNIDPPTIQLLRGETRQLRPVFLRADGEPASASAVSWASLNPGVASVDAATGSVVGIAVGQGAVQATAGGLSAVATVEVEEAPFAFSVPVLGLSPGAEAPIEVVVPAQRGRPLANAALTWRSSNEQVVRVTPLGVARAVAPGAATIVVEGFGQVRELPVRIHRAVAFVDATPAFSRGPIQVPMDGARTFRVVSKAADETEIPDAPVVWSVADTTVAVFDAATGALTGRKLGTTALTATPAGPGLEVTWQIEVIAGGIVVNPDRIGFGIGEVRALAASFTTEDGTPLGPAQGVQWTTENANVAQVTGEGRLTAVGTGSTRIIAATQWGRADTVSVFVSGPLLFASTASGSADLVTLDPSTAGAKPQPVTDDPANEAMADWSPDGSRIVFVSDRDGNYELYVADADGANARRLTNTPDVAEITPVWTPDGAIVYGTQAAGGRLQIWTIGADGAGAQALTTDADGANLDPAVSPDGRQIAFTTTRDGNYDVYVMDRDGANPRAVLRSPAKESKPAWFPNGDLAYVQERTERGQPVPVVVRQATTDGAAPQPLSPPALPVTDFAVSSTGDLLVLEVATPTAAGRFEHRLFVLPIGGTPTELPREAGAQHSNPALRPAGAH